MTGVVSKADIDEAHKRFPDDATVRYGYLEGIRRERERCAKICDHYVTPYGRAGSQPDYAESAARKLAEVIRAGQQ